MKRVQYDRRLLCLSRYGGILFSAVIFFIAYAGDNDLKRECYEKYHRQIREKTASLAAQLRLKVAERTAFVEREMAKDSTYQTELAVLKAEREKTGNKKSLVSKYASARERQVKKLENKPAMKELDNEIHSLNNEIKVIVKDVVKDDPQCKHCLTVEGNNH